MIDQIIHKPNGEEVVLQDPYRSKFKAELDEKKHRIDILKQKYLKKNMESIKAVPNLTQLKKGDEDQQLTKDHLQKANQPMNSSGQAKHQPATNEITLPSSSADRSSKIQQPKDAIKSKLLECRSNIYKEIDPSSSIATSMKTQNRSHPSRSLIVQEIIQKKLESSEIRADKENFPSQSLDQIEQRLGSGVKLQYIPKMQGIILPFDEEYLDLSDTSIKELSNPLKLRSIEEEVYLWINHPSNLLSDDLLNEEHLPEHHVRQSLVLTSKNATYHATIGGLISQFVFRSKGQISEAQKDIAYSLSLEYFYSNANELSPEFLMILIKLGGTYLSKYSLFFKQNLQKYCKSILQNKACLSNSQRSAIVTFLIDQKECSEVQILYLLLIFPAQKLISLLATKQINTIKQIIMLLSAIQLSRREFPLLTSLVGVYLRLINSLIDKMPENHHIVENILNHINEMQASEKYYHLHKQVKLKLISILAQRSNEQNQNGAEEVVKENRKSGGFIGYWSKAVDKLKTATNQLTDPKLERSKTQSAKKQEKMDESALRVAQKSPTNIEKLQKGDDLSTKQSKIAISEFEIKKG